jgi:hypothetical protein
MPSTLCEAADVDLVYINELVPSTGDLDHLRKEIRRGATDVFPTNGSSDFYHLNAWQPGNALPEFSETFRFARAIRVLPVNTASQGIATQSFDGVVRQIEDCVGAEEAAGRIIKHWQACGDDDTCAACDFRHFCPSPAPHTGPHIIESPNAP